MGLYFSESTIMRPVHYPGNEEFCKMLLKHDWRMISNIVNYDLELIKPYIDNSMTFLSKVNFGQTSKSEVLRIIKYIYSKRKYFKKKIMSFVLRDYIDISDDEEFKEMMREIMYENPEYVLIIEHKTLLKLCELIDIDYRHLVLTSDFKKVQKRMQKIKYSEDSRQYEELSKKLIYSDWWYFSRSEIFVNRKNIDEKIEKLMEDFPNHEDLQPILLLWKLA